MVVRVKLDTTIGSMVRELIAPVAAVKEKKPFEAVSPVLLPVRPALQCCVLPCSAMTLPCADASWTCHSCLHLAAALRCCHGTACPRGQPDVFVFDTRLSEGFHQHLHHAIIYKTVLIPLT